MPQLHLIPLTEQNFETYSSFLNAEDPGCYCSFWHQKIASMQEWETRKAQEPEKNKSCVLERLRSRFHVGVLVYQDQNPDPVAWVSIASLPEFYWTWKRVAQLGNPDSTKFVAAIPCITRKTEYRASVSEQSILEALVPYAKQQGWTAIEGYPFDRESIDKHGDGITWPGLPEDFAAAGFARVCDHWMSSVDYRRSIYRLEL